MDCLAALFASHIRPGDCYCLFGAVGAGKSVFSRAFIRAVAEDDFLPVPSPTFLLQNTYNEHQGPPIHHFDFYRLTSVQDFTRLDLEGSLALGVCLMEWPERLPELPGEYLSVHIDILDRLPPELEASSSSDNGHAEGNGNGAGRRKRCGPSRGKAFMVSDSIDSDAESNDIPPPCSTSGALREGGRLSA
jgi:tRNA threonylcarbamoyladenosine biosynthesis protein TsaE